MRTVIPAVLHEPEQLSEAVQRIQRVYGSWSRETSVAQMRADWDALFGVDRPDVVIESVQVGETGAEWIKPEKGGSAVVLYLHGGGFKLGSLVSHRELMVGIAKAAGVKVLGLAYRLAPEFRFPGALEDTCAAYQWLLAQDISAEEIVLAGDSAGGNLVMTALIRLRDEGYPMPAGAVLLSPWTDLTASGDSYETRKQADPIHQRRMIQAMAEQYLAGADPQLASPLFADLHGLPPTLIQVGDAETVLSDAVDLAQRLDEAGNDVHLQVWPRMIHVFQQFPNELSEARQARQEIGVFIRRALALKPV